MSTQISITMGRLIPWLTLPALGGCVVGETALPTSTDRDADGVHTPDDCDDRDPAVYPGAPEVCDGIDNDCSGTPDDNPIDGLLLYTDADADGHGIAPLFYGCSQAEGAIQAGDCNDLDPAIHPGADDTNCDGIDDDCDGLIDGDQWFEGFADRDGDGYGDPDQPTESCDPFAVVPNSDDCDDNDSAIHPAGEEVCGDQVDSDCDGTPGEACGIEDADDPIEVTLAAATVEPAHARDALSERLRDVVVARGRGRLEGGAATRGADGGVGPQGHAPPK
ncbi:MAG: hypothetical protein CL927_09155, partial [Deltaproteobacteria bacterium]|nr:hypothetical protein [Deltaproteobacteria bacterium]